MSSESAWNPVGPDVDSVLRQFDEPLASLAKGEFPAVVLRNSLDEEQCQTWVNRLVTEELLFDPKKPMPEKFVDQLIPEGFYREGSAQMAKYAWQSGTAKEGSANANVIDKARIDVGSSLGYRGSDKVAFLEHCRQTHELFGRLFNSTPNPLSVLYDSLQKLAATKKVQTAREPDGELYGPAIFRAHYGGYEYKPHFDSVRLREKRENYSVHQFDHQFAGVLVLQNSTVNERVAQTKIHNCFWQPELDSVISENRFHEYAEKNQIENIEILLNPGDLYFFNTRHIHEVPGFAGELPRIVLATFIGYSEDCNDVFVWS